MEMLVIGVEWKDIVSYISYIEKFGGSLPNDEGKREEYRNEFHWPWWWNNITNLDISDFFVDSGEKLNFLNGDGFVPTD